VLGLTPLLAECAACVGGVGVRRGVARLLRAGRAAESVAALRHEVAALRLAAEAPSGHDLGSQRQDGLQEAYATGFAF